MHRKNFIIAILLRKLASRFLQELKLNNCRNIRCDLINIFDNMKTTFV